MAVKVRNQRQSHRFHAMKLLSSDGGGGKSADVHLNIVPLVDMMMVLVIFLVMNFNATGEMLFLSQDMEMVRAENGLTAAYDKLVIATGSNPFIIPVPGHDLPGVMVYRDLDDVEQMIAQSAKPGAKAVVIGGGLLGLGL